MADILYQVTLPTKQLSVRGNLTKEEAMKSIVETFSNFVVGAMTEIDMENSINYAPVGQSEESSASKAEQV